jgi:altronate hydrolase
MKKAVRIEPEDNVAVVVQDVAQGENVDCSGLEVKSANAIAKGHKIALSSIPKGGDIVKYAVVIGKASHDIVPGEHVHSHNVEDITDRLCNQYAQQFRAMKG